MQAIVLAGGLGTRLRPITYTRPKPLLNILNRPLIDWVLDILPREFDEVFLATGYLGDRLEEHFRARKMKRRVEIVIEDKPLGTGGAIKNLSDRINGPFAVLNGDVVCSLDVGKMLSFHRKSKGLGTIALWTVKDPSAFGMVVMDRKKKILQFKEKPRKDEVTSHSVNAGTYILEPEMLDFIEPGKTVSIEREVFPRALENGLYGYGFSGYWFDGGTLPNFIAIHKRLMAKIIRGKGLTQLGPAVWKPPVLTGKNVTVGPDAVVGPNACIGDNVSIGPNCRLSNCIIYDGVTMGDGAVVKDSLVGDEAELDPGTIVSSRILGAKEKVVRLKRP